ncbi:MAG: hypothetical protein QNI84_08525 [Henriciella sp.]|nr:hypothetical protein [Henriciella sp.]
MTSSKSDIIEAGLNAALKLAETEAWQDLTLAAIAEEAGLTLKDFHGVADKADLSAEVEAKFDAAMSEGSISPEETPRTRLFDVIMMRFEAMEEVRDGAMSFLRWRDRSLSGLSLRVQARGATAKWALTCAGLDKADGAARQALIVGVAWTIAQAERAWRKETSADLTRTMAALDSELLKLEDRINLLKRRRRSRHKPSGEPATE